MDNAPKAKKAFDKAANPDQNANTNQQDKSSAAPSKPITKQQVEQLEALRKAPKLELHLTPPGVHPPKSQEDRKREARLVEMKKRLQEKTGKARDDFNRAK